MKTKQERLTETIRLEELRGGEFLDLYNRIIRRDGICGTIKETIDKNSHFYVVVKDDRKT